MSNLTAAFILVSVIFAIALALKVKIKKTFCAICAGVSLSWIMLLALREAGLFQDKTIIALLVGQSITGVYYLAEAKVSRSFGIFRLAFLLTLTLAGYVLARGDGEWKSSLLALLALWIIFTVIYFGKNNKKFGALAKRLIECCKNW